MNSTVVVFGNDHTNTVGVIQSLGGKGYDLIGLLFGVKTDLVISSRYTKEIITAENPQACIDKILKILPKQNGKIPIIPCCDIAALTLEQNAALLREAFIFGFAKNFSLDYLSRKGNQVSLAEESGFNVPHTWLLGESKILPEGVIYPNIIKPTISSKGAKIDIKVCRAPDELENNLLSLKYTRDVLLQQYIERDYEISILGCGLSSGKCLIPVIENKLTLFPKHVGLECVANMQPLDNQEIISCIETLISKIGYVGLFSIEMMHCRDDDKFYFTEINLRNDGANALVTKYGANLPLNHIEDLLGQQLTEQNRWHPGFYIWDMHHFLSLVHGDISIISWLKDIKKSNGFMLYFKEDKKPFYKQYSNWVLSKLHIRKNKSYD